MNDNYFLVLVTFERLATDCEYLTDGYLGAVGYMAVRAINAESVESQLRLELLEVNLDLIETADIQPLPSLSELVAIDEHLASNVSAWEAGRTSCWGTTHEYKFAHET
jgi:hypothetical protein